MEAGKSKICRLGPQAGDPGSAEVAAQVQRHLLRIPSCLEDVGLLFYSDLQLFDQGPPPSGRKSALHNLLILNINFMKNTRTEIPILMFNQIPGDSMAQSS